MTPGRLCIAIFAALGLLASAAPRARACGGGLVARPAATAASDAQLIFLSVKETSTEVVTVVRVPDGSSDFGVLLPMPAVPVIDPQPVPVAELEMLRRTTQPEILISQPADDDGGCGCILPAGDVKAGAASPGSGRVPLGDPITVGPVTAVVLDAGSAAALGDWLAENGFVLPPEHAGMIASYSGPGRTFVAIRRAAAPAAAGAASVGLHLTVPGDQRTLPLRFARLGAAPTVAFTVFVAAKTFVQTALPFATLTLDDLPAPTLRASGYDAAVLEAVKGRASQAFVAEGTLPLENLDERYLGPSLRALVPDPKAMITRLHTRVAATALNADVELSIPLAQTVPDRRVVSAGLVRGEQTGRRDPPGRGPSAPVRLGLTALLLALGARTVSRRRRAPALSLA